VQFFCWVTKVIHAVPMIFRSPNPTSRTPAFRFDRRSIQKSRPLCESADCAGAAEREKEPIFDSLYL
jgi:hypothetical protein